MKIEIPDELIRDAYLCISGVLRSESSHNISRFKTGTGKDSHERIRLAVEDCIREYIKIYHLKGTIDALWEHSDKGISLSINSDPYTDTIRLLVGTPPVSHKLEGVDTTIFWALLNFYPIKYNR